MKFKGVFHPVLISPTRVLELFKVTEKPEGRFLFNWNNVKL